MGLFLSTEFQAQHLFFLSSLSQFPILGFDPWREHSFVPTTDVDPPSRATVVKDGARSAPPEACP
jgi:hypothetical protein